MPTDVRAFVRIAAVIVLSTIALAMVLPDVAAPWHPWGSYGFDASFDGRISNVYPGMPAAAAGVHVGDRVDLRAASADATRSLTPFGQAWPGTSAVFPMRVAGRADRMGRLTAVPWPRSALDNVTDIIAVLFEIAFILIPAWLVLTRPSLLTWSFFIFATNTGYTSAILQELLPAHILRVVNGLIGASITVGAYAFASFALLFPRLAPDRYHRRMLTLLAVPTVLVLLAQVVQAPMALGHYAATISTQAAIATVTGVDSVGMYIVAIVLFLVNYRRAAAVDRPRIRWAILGFALAFGGNLFITVSQNTPAIALSPPVWAVNLLSALDILAPVSVAYAILKHRVIDVRFFLSRALVYGLLTTGVVVALALIEWAIARRLEETNLGLLVEVAGAVAIGLGFQRAHGWIDSLVDRFVFRTIHDAEKRFGTIGRAMMYARSASAIDGLMADETIRALHLAGAAIYHPAEDGSYARTFSAGRPFRDGFDHDHHIVLHLLAERTPIERDGELAVPFIVRDRLLGFALFGAHANNTAIDPNERALLEELCFRAASAYDHVESEARAEENARLRGALTILQARYDEVRSIAGGTS